MRSKFLDALAYLMLGIGVAVIACCIIFVISLMPYEALALVGVVIMVLGFIWAVERVNK